MNDTLEISREIAAPPEVVFAALTDITRMGEWSPETHGAEWVEGSEAAVGAVFKGQNRSGSNEWETEAVIVELVPNEHFAFDCRVGDFVFATWGYRIEATEAGSLVTEHWEDHRPDEVKELSVAISGVTDRVSHNQAGMTETLARLAAAVE